MARANPFHINQHLHPHHIVYHPLASGFYWAWVRLGWHAGSLLPLQILNVLLSIACLGIFFALLNRLTHPTLALAVTLVLGAANSYWLYSVEVEVYILSVFFLTATFYKAVFIPTNLPNKTHGLTSGVLLAGAILSHQSNLLFAPVVALAILSTALPRKDKLTMLVVSGMTAGIIVVGVYSAVITILQIKTLRDAQAWMTAYIQLGSWGHFQGNSLELALQGLRQAFLATGSPRPAELNFPPILVLGLASWIAFQYNRRIVLLCLLWFLPYAIFITWWEPTNIEFWMSCLVPLLVIVALAMEKARGQLRMKAVILVVLISALLAAELYFNFHNTILPRQNVRLDIKRQAILELSSCLRTNDTVIISTYQMKPWLEYYTGVKALPIDEFFLKDGRYLSRDLTVGQAFASLRSVINAELQQNGNFFVTGEALMATKLVNRFNVYSKDLELFFFDYTLQKTPCQYSATHITGSPRLPLFELVEKKP